MEKEQKNLQLTITIFFSKYHIVTIWQSVKLTSYFCAKAAKNTFFICSLIEFVERRTTKQKPEKRVIKKPVTVKTLLLV